MLIGITGKARHGKDTVGKMLLPYFDDNHVLFAYASPIKDFIKLAFSAPQDIEENKEGIQEFHTDESLLASSIEETMSKALDHFDISKEYALGTLLCILYKNFKVTNSDHGEMLLETSWRELMQEIGTAWGRGVLHTNFWITPWLPQDNAIITDVRRNNEVVAILKRGGIVIRVDDPRKGSMVKQHVSEGGIGDFYITTSIINDGSLKDLSDKVHSFVAQYL